MLKFDGMRTRKEGRVLFASLDAPPLNLIGPDVVRGLVGLVKYLEQDQDDVSVVVLDSAVPDFFSAHVDLAHRPGLYVELAKLEEGASLAKLFRRISSLRQVSIASIAGRVRGAGSELILACDMRFASKEKALFGQWEVACGAIPGAGACQHLTRLMGRARALEVLLSSNDYTSDMAERYGWINRALPDAELNVFVETLARRIASFPAAGLADTKNQVHAVSLPSLQAMEEDAGLFLKAMSRPDTQARLQQLLRAGLQTVGDVELRLGEAVGKLTDS